MADTRWSSFMSVGVEALDADHRQLLDVTAQLEEAVAKGACNGTIGGILDRLSDYAHTHLSREEHLMDRLRFPDEGPHRMSHEVFRRWISDFKAAYEADPEPGISKKVLDYLNNWWISHILKSDMDYKHFFIAHEGKVEALLSEFDDLQLAASAE